jgi:hypothetical protein
VNDTKEVEWIGGPRDGLVEAFPEDVVIVRISLPAPILDPISWRTGPPIEIDLPIKRRDDGRFYVVFHYPEF